MYPQGAAVVVAEGAEASAAVASAAAVALAKAIRWAADAVTASAKGMASPQAQVVETMAAGQDGTTIAVTTGMADTAALAAVDMSVMVQVAIEHRHQIRCQKLSACNRQIRATSGDSTKVRTPQYHLQLTLFYPQRQHQW